MRMAEQERTRSDAWRVRGRGGRQLIGTVATHRWAGRGSASASHELQSGGWRNRGLGQMHGVFVVVEAGS